MKWMPLAAAVLALAACDRTDPPARGAAEPAASVPPAVATCVGCHGAHGEGNAAAAFPRLAGQSKKYLRHQLDSFADGTRPSATMKGIAHALAPEQRDAAAAHFASIENAPPPAGTALPTSADVERGRVIAELGDPSKQIQACRHCHGPEGSGVGMQLPYLAGQPAQYTTRAMALFRDGSRRSDPMNQMPQIAQALGEADAAAVAAYYAKQAAPAVPLDRAAAPTAAASTPAAPQR
jgi:cytochrome c553